MGNDATQNDNQNAGSQNGDPANGGVQPQAGGVDVTMLAKKLEELEKRVADKDSYITELSNVNKALEQRINSVTAPVSENDSTPATVADPAKYVSVDQIPGILEQQLFIKDIKRENADLIDLGLEPAMELRARQLLSQGKEFREAVGTAVKEAREKVNKLKQPSSSSQPPAGVIGEDGKSGVPPAPKPKAEDPMEDEGPARVARRMKMGL
jgi:hypothetical protein